MLVGDVPTVKSDSRTDAGADDDAGPFGFRWTSSTGGSGKRKSQSDRLELAKAKQAGKPAKPRRPMLKSVDLDVASNVVGAIWTMAGLIARLPMEVILMGTAVTQSLAVGQSILAKDEEVRERNKRESNNDEEG